MSRSSENTLAPTLRWMKDGDAYEPRRSHVAQVAVIGAGKMGEALIRSWLNAGLAPDEIAIAEPFPTTGLRETTNQHGIVLVESVTDLAPSSVIFLAVKPQIADGVLPYIRPLVGNRSLIISVMAGKTINRISQTIGRHAAIVRAMPNLPITVGRGMTAAVQNTAVSADQHILADALLAATGRVEWIDDERLMDAVTAVSGSGPAYVFLLAEELARAGVQAGLPRHLAEILARETVAGSGELLYQSDLDAQKLRENVTSPGGTTAAALEVLMRENELRALLVRAVEAAKERSRELAD